MSASVQPAQGRGGRTSAGTLGGLLSEAAGHYGPNPALVIKPGLRTHVVTYAELERLSLRVAHLLQGKGIEKGDRVLLWASNVPEWVEVFFGCMSIGVVVVPIDVRSSLDFVRAVAQQTSPKLAVLSRVTGRLAEELGIPSIQLEELETLLAAEPIPAASVSVEADDLAEIVFTSGTTGDPKGVMLSHGNIVANVRSANDVLPIKQNFRLLSLLPLSHMFEQSVGLLAALSGGARVVYPVSRQPSVLFRTMAENQITMLCLVPQALQLFWNAIEREARREGREATLTRLLRLAERLPMNLRRVLFRSIHARMGGGLEVVISGGAYLDPGTGAPLGAAGCLGASRLRRHRGRAHHRVRSPRGNASPMQSGARIRASIYVSRGMERSSRAAQTFSRDTGKTLRLPRWFLTTAGTALETWDPSTRKRTCISRAERKTSSCWRTARTSTLRTSKTRSRGTRPSRKGWLWASTVVRETSRCTPRCSCATRTVPPRPSARPTRA